MQIYTLALFTAQSSGSGRLTALTAERTELAAQAGAGPMLILLQRTERRSCVPQEGAGPAGLQELLLAQTCLQGRQDRDSRWQHDWKRDL